MIRKNNKHNWMIISLFIMWLLFAIPIAIFTDLSFIILIIVAGILIVIATTDIVGRVFNFILNGLEKK